MKKTNALPNCQIIKLTNYYLGLSIDFSNIQNLQPEAQALYFHEYVHFLQDITTTFGLSNSWNTYDRIRQIISLLRNVSFSKLMCVSKDIAAIGASSALVTFKRQLLTIIL